MFPLLPALILLLLHGPANLERMADRGALPAALAAIQQKMESPQVQASRANEKALASLLNLSGNPQLASAFAKLFALQISCDLSPTEQPNRLSAHGSTGEPPPSPNEIGQPQNGFLNSQRSRDGPVSR